MRQLYLLLLMLAPLATQAQTASFTTSADTVCQDSCITLINTSTGTIDSVKWYVQGIVLSTPHDDTINVCFPLAGIDTAKLYIYYGASLDSFVHAVTIAPKPHPSFIGGGIKVANVYLSYQWYDDSGPIPGATNSTCGSYGMGGYYVVVDSGGCLGKSDVFYVTDGIDKTSSMDHGIKLYPNPAASQVTIFSPGKVSSITISNLIGQTLYTGEYSSPEVQIDLTNLPAGVYLVRINGTEVRRFIKE